ncbi:MAG TPA: division/cell wall cluster transcriptional repressor MraZ [Pirellulaceae bacterium]|jgi:MraZ protein|nr:division/cell wall cluster transcriptional repressor MraZ [Pirellulaceae bacterium]
MLLTGTFVRAIDEKQRIAVPKPVRDSLGFPCQKVLYLAPGTDGCIQLYPEDIFTDLAAQLGRTPPTGQDVRAFSRMFYAQAQRVEIDRQGRLRVPLELAEFGRLSKEVVLLGVRDHLELWNRDQWNSYLAETQPRYDEIAESAFGQSPPAGGSAFVSEATENITTKESLRSSRPR